MLYAGELYGIVLGEGIVAKADVIDETVPFTSRVLGVFVVEDRILVHIDLAVGGVSWTV